MLYVLASVSDWFIDFTVTDDVRDVIYKVLNMAHKLGDKRRLRGHGR